MKKSYLPSVVLAGLAAVCLVCYQIIGAKVLQNGMLKEPFYLVGLAWIFVGMAIIWAVIITLVRWAKRAK